MLEMYYERESIVNLEEGYQNYKENIKHLRGGQDYVIKQILE